jgi:hypothetical protein
VVSNVLSGSNLMNVVGDGFKSNKLKGKVYPIDDLTEFESLFKDKKIVKKKKKEISDKKLNSEMQKF